MADTSLPTLKAKDFSSDQDVRWCPGCGDYSILNAVQRVCANIGATRENSVFISDIGCSSRFPYYMDTYGCHTIHGRAPGFVTGVKMANPDLDVWMITGDGDGLSIGGNHLMHLLRRNVNVNAMLFNNRIYGLTKGQYSPTTVPGMKTPSTPFGSLDAPFNPIALALSAKASFVARAVDVMGPHLQEILAAAAAHEGSAFIEIFQNCNIFNDGAWDHLVDREVRSEMLVDLRPGEKAIFGAQKDKALVLDGFTPKVVNVADVDENDIITWDVEANPALSYIMASMTEGELPTAIGIFRDVKRESFDAGTHRQIADARAKFGEGSLEKLVYAGDMWEVK